MAEQQDRSSPHPCGNYGAARPGRMRDSTALGSIHGKDRVAGQGSRRPRKSSPSSRHLTSPLTVPRELRRCRLAWRLPPTRSHGGSQGFKSPHLHPHNSHGHRPGGLLSPGRCRSRVAGRAANGQQPRTKRPRCLIAGHDDVVKRGQDSRPYCESVPTLPPGPAPDHPGCSGTGPIPSSAVLRRLVLAPGLPERLPLSCVAPVNLP